MTLQSEDMGKLVAGKSVVWSHVKSTLCVVQEVEEGIGLHVRWLVSQGGVQLIDITERFTLIGTLTEDGWIEGEWAENPVPGMDVEIRCPDRSESEAAEDSDFWNWKSDHAPIIAFRPAHSEADWISATDRAWAENNPVAHGEAELSGNAGELKAQPENRIVRGLREALAGDVSVRAQSEPCDCVRCQALSDADQPESDGGGELSRQIDILRRAAEVPVPDDDHDFSIEKARRGAESWRTIARNVVAAHHAHPTAEGQTEGAVAALLSDLRKGRDGRPVGDPVRDEFEAHIATVAALASKGV